ncbi:hypothetical protein [Amycolatopsis sp. NPDC004079]|uniref:hypothetical protein n=1 Tax=Amycolatopsis sp. NPDC004079 TaxID=3154549 RepID=UPI0033BA0E6B
MNTSNPRPAPAGRALSWQVDDPTAPARPDVRAALARADARQPSSRMASVGNAVLFCVPLVLFQTTAAEIATSGLNALGLHTQVPPGAVALLALLVVAAVSVLQLAGALRQSIRWRDVRAAQDALDVWSEQYQIDRNQLPDGQVRADADRIDETIHAIDTSRARRDGWIEDELLRTLRARQWSMLTRQRDSVEVRTELAEAEQLAEHSPALVVVARDRHTEITDLDAELARFAEELEELRSLVRALDEALDDADRARAQRERADDLARKLGGDALPAEDAEAWHRRLRDEALAEGSADADLTILAAQLQAITRHVAEGARSGRAG